MRSFNEKIGKLDNEVGVETKFRLFQANERWRLGVTEDRQQA
jgi:hypothetical protein